ncbi:MAG TPA: hypothetical protein VKT81_23835 [Bryobacteraceae bacterium]|nr:hypothetical protein [Bryobacteraceae bacterium]
MKKTLCAVLVSAGVLLAQEHPARVVVTVEGVKDAAPPSLNKEDVMVYLDNQRMRVTGWSPVQNDPAGIELWLLIDDGADSSLGTEFEELRHFVLEQPAATKVGIGYLRNGSVDALQKPTADHAAAAKAIRLPIAQPGVSASPYLALSDLIKKWPAGDAAREVVMVTSGVDPDNGPGPSNLYLDRAIAASQRAGVVVNAIYFPSAGHFGHSRWQINWGQNYLSQLTEETGGEFFWLGDATPVSFARYFKELNQHLRNQYLLTFVTQGKPGQTRLKLKTEVPHVNLLGPSSVYVQP